MLASGTPAGTGWRPCGGGTGNFHAGRGSNPDSTITARASAGPAPLLPSRALVLFAAICGLLIGPHARAQNNDFDYQVELQAPRAYRTLLRDNLDIYKWQKSPRMSLPQLRRLHAQTPEAVKELLATEGYYSARVRSELEQRGGRWVARFEVEPGEPVRVTEVRIAFSGAVTGDAARTRRLERDWSLKKGQVFKNSAWEKAKRALLRDLIVDRYPQARDILTRASVNPESREAVLDVRVDSGPAFAFGPVRISGLERYPENIVRRLAPFNAGDPYTQDKLLEYQAKIQETAYFSSALVTLERDTANPKAAPVRVALVENPTKTLSFGVGVSTNTGARVQANYTDHNVFDRAWQWTNELKLESKQQSAATELAMPLDAKGYRHSVGTTLERTDIAGEEAQKLSVFARRARTRGRLPGDQIETAWDLRYLLERQIITGSDEDINRALTANYTWIRRTLNDPLYPTRGYVLNLQGGGALEAFLSDQTFARTYAKHVHFFLVTSRDVVILRGELGVVFAESRDGIPTDMLFRAGGDQSVRGYSYQSLGVPEGNAVVAGRYLAVGSAEIVHWITPQYGAAAFVDVGDAADSRDELNANAGVGIGARWKSPVGPLAVDVAYGVETQKPRLHLQVGFTF